MSPPAALAEPAPSLRLPSGAELMSFTGDAARDIALILSRRATAAIRAADQVAAEMFLFDAYAIAAGAYPDGPVSEAVSLRFTLRKVTEAFNRRWPDAAVDGYTAS